jgi:hypothetical protein
VTGANAAIVLFAIPWNSGNDGREFFSRWFSHDKSKPRVIWGRKADRAPRELAGLPKGDEPMKIKTKVKAGAVYRGYWD